MLDWVGETFVTLVEQGRTYVFLLPIYVGLLGGERLAHELTSDRKWDDRDGAANIAITVVTLVLDVSIGTVLPVGLMAWLYEHARLVELPAGALGWLVAFLLHDLTWYVDHRLGHRVGLLWALHHVHHSSEQYNTTVASRGFVFDNTFARPLFFLLPLLGVTPFHFIAIRIVTSVFGIAQHTRLVPRLGVLDRILATPSSHRVHHGRDPVYIDKNYGEVLMLWDHLFGTYQPEGMEPTYGVTVPIGTYNPLRIELAGIAWLVARVRSSRAWRERLWALVAPPEWQPEDREAPLAQVASLRDAGPE